MSRPRTAASWEWLRRVWRLRSATADELQRIHETGLDSPQIFLPAGGTGSQVLGVPNDPVFTGVHVLVQSAAFAAGVNPFGVVASNGIDLGVDAL